MNEGKAPTVDLDLAVSTEEVDPETLVVGDGGTTLVGELRTALAFPLLPSLRRACLNWAGAIHAESPLGDVDVVGTPVSDHASTVFHVVAPVWEVVVHPARAEYRAIRTQRPRAAPQVPVKPGFHFLFLEVTGAAGVTN